jgi:hypothetical protein
LTSQLLEFQVSDPDVLRARLTGAGLRDVNVDTVTEKLAFGSGDEFWKWVMFSNPIAALLTGHLTAEQQVDMRRILDGMRERAGGRGSAILTTPCISAMERSDHLAHDRMLAP